MCFNTSAAPAGRNEFGTWAGRLGHPGMSSGVGCRAVPVGDQRERIRGAIRPIVIRLPDDHRWVEARLLGHPAVIRPGGDQGTTALAGHTRVPPNQGPAARVNEVVDKACPTYVAG